MATINSRNESNKFIKQVGSDFIHKPSDELEDKTNDILNINSDVTFNVYSDLNCLNLVGNFQLLFRANDGVYVKLSNISDCELYADFDYENDILLVGQSEEKLIDWANLNSSTVINTVLRTL